jgi:hypothetical protein
MIKLVEILNQVIDDKTILSSSPQNDDIKRFHDVTKNLLRLFKGNHKTFEKDILHNKGNYENMLSPQNIVSIPITHHLAEYKGEKFTDFTKKLAQVYEKSGFKVEIGYGSDDVNGFEVLGKDGEVIGEVDFLAKNSLPDLGDTIIIKHRKI